MNRLFLSNSTRPALHSAALLLAVWAICFHGAARVTSAQSGSAENEDNGKGVRFGDFVTEYWQVGVKIRAIGGSCQGFYVTIPVPNDWYDQEVKLVDEDFSLHVGRVKYRVMDHGVRQMVLNIPRIQADSEARALVTFEVKTRVVLPPENTDIFTIPKRVDREIKIHTNPSPYINSRSSSIRRKVRELVAGKDKAWEQVRAIYDFVHDEVKIAPSGKMVGSEATLRNMSGIGEDKVNLFVALCRSHGVPCRIVWVRGHFYPEFYLIDDEKVGHWFPCEVVGNTDFGSYSKPRPILQRGDNIKVPEKKERLRFVPEFLQGKKSRGKPRITFIRAKVAKPMPK